MCARTCTVGPWGHPSYHGTRHFEMSAFQLLSFFIIASSAMRRTSNAASGGGGGGRVSKLKKRRRHTGSPTPSSLSAPASGARQTADASTRTQPSSLSNIAAPSNTGTNPLTSTSNGRGSIQIISERGATIRNLYDLDEAEISLGRLAQHERRPYVEKKWLPEPPPEDYDDDEEDDDECVGVFRYKIILSPEDRQKLVPNGLAHHEFGWISDRGRLASDPYVICKEL